MPGFVDLGDQVQDILRVGNGGTGNPWGNAQERVLVPFVNDGGATLAVGDVVRLSPTLVKTSAAGQKVLGVIAGHYDADGLVEEAAVAASEVAAICVFGRAMVKLGANVSRNDYLAASGTAGAATGATGASGGAFAQALYAGSSGNLVPAMVSAGGSTGDSGLFTINAVVTGGPSVPQTGNQFAIVCDIDLTIVANTLVAIQTGSAVVDVLKSTYAGYSGSLTSICASAKPTLSSAIKSQDTTLTGWTTSINAGDILVVELESIATITSVTLALKCRRGH